MQKNLEDVKNELKFLLPKVSNEAGVAELNSIISSIQAVQDLTDDNRRKWLYEYPYRNQPNFYDEQKETFGNFGVPSGRLITQDEDPWQKGQISAPLGPTMTLKQALSRWKE